MKRLIVPAAVLLLAGPAAAGPRETFGWAGAASMRVEVEVYRGPLSKTTEEQVGELSAVTEQAVSAVKQWETRAIDIYKWQCAVDPSRQTPTLGAECSAVEEAIKANQDVLKALWPLVLGIPARDLACIIPETGNGTSAEVKELTRPSPLAKAMDRAAPIAATTPISLNSPILHFKLCYEGVARRVAGAGLVMHSVAQRATNITLRVVPVASPLRGVLASQAFLLSEFGNQMSSRLAVLEKQITPLGPPARLLPLTDYLRDAGHTDFIKLFDWLGIDAVGKANAGGLDRGDRIRMIERLGNDLYWEKINEVYTSGQGDTSMAFIKDDLGNWNLKTFSSDPSKLLAAWRKVTDATLASAAKLATSVASGGTSTIVKTGAAKLGLVERLGGLAGTLGTGEAAATPTTGAFGIEQVHGRTAAKLRARQAQFAARHKTLTDARDAEAKAGASNPDEAVKLESAIRQGTLNAQLAALPAEARAAAHEVLTDHLAILAAMQEAAVTPAAAPGLK